MSAHAVSLGGAAPLGSGPRRSARVLPGFNLTLGYTIVYLSLIVLIPLSALALKTLTLSWPQFWEAVTSPRVLASYRLTFGASLLAALVNVVFGLLVAWVLVRYSFPGKKNRGRLGRSALCLAHGGGGHFAHCLAGGQRLGGAVL